jgi:hypothetical protein
MTAAEDPLAPGLRSEQSPGRPRKQQASGFPVVIAEWPRSRRELVRVAIDHYQGGYTIDLRSWSRDASGVYRPGRQGLTLAVSHIPKVAEALQKALSRAKIFGLI